MSAFVLDCSVAINWFVEGTYEMDDMKGLVEQLRAGKVIVPALWHIEFINALMVSERRGRIDAEELASIVRISKKWQITTETDHDRALDEVLDLARAESLSAYDAAYLDLAMRLEIPLATLDKKLAAAAAKNGVTVLPGDYSLPH